MSLHFDLGPRDGVAVVRAGLQRLAGRKSSLELDGPAFGALGIGSQHAVYDLRADQIAAGGGLETAHASGFRYLVTNQSTAVAAAEVRTDPAEGSWLLSNLNYGPYVVASAQAFADLATLDAVRNSDYEVRLLRFSAIYLVAIWLKASGGAADIVYPLSPAPNALRAGTVYTPEAFLSAIRPLAQQRVNQPDPTKIP